MPCGPYCERLPENLGLAGAPHSSETISEGQESLQTTKPTQMINESIIHRKFMILQYQHRLQNEEVKHSITLLFQIELADLGHHAREFPKIW